jgi:hypothetical protein
MQEHPTKKGGLVGVASSYMFQFLHYQQNSFTETSRGKSGKKNWNENHDRFHRPTFFPSRSLSLLYIPPLPDKYTGDIPYLTLSL